LAATCNNLLVITNDYEAQKEEEWFGTKRKIKFIPLWKWLLA
jgi:predicted AAA+ superfamily ATPase